MSKSTAVRYPDSINMESILFNTDSYKISHWLQYPKDTLELYSYIEARGGPFKESLFFGLQYLMRKYLSNPFTKEDLQQAVEFYKVHNNTFNENGFKHILNKHGGYMPVEIRAVKEGMKVPVKNVLTDVRSTDPAVVWVGGWVEAMLLRSIWYPTSVATLSYEIKKLINIAWIRSSDSPKEDMLFKLHDFGARGVSSLESAAIGGAAHLINFRGTDTISGAILPMNHYGLKGPAGFSIAAAEHSTITSWGKENEVEAYRNMIETFGGSGFPYAVVSDSYDLLGAITHLWGESLKEEVMNAKGALVIRPDSGDPKTVVLQCLEIMAAKFGFTVNSKGYKVINKVRLIQGDGVNLQSIEEILDAIDEAKFSIDNIAFGMGGALLQGVTRDTMAWAMKCAAINRGGSWFDVFKDPITDPGKASKKGQLGLYKKNGQFYTDRQQNPGIDHTFHDYLEPAFRNGEILRHQNYEEIRALSEM